MTTINGILFFLVALIYSSAGFGGGSMYLALLAQSGLSPVITRISGLSCNALVTATGSWNFISNGWLSWRYVWPLLICSLPPCMFAASIHLEEAVYFVLLGFALLIAGILMMLRIRPSRMEDAPSGNPLWLYPLVVLIGFVSGLTGIGGGIYLAPLLHLANWGSSKHIAATASIFILLNSVASSLIFISFQPIAWNDFPLWYLPLVFAGGFIGSRMSSSILRQNLVRWITTLLILFVACRILVKYL